METEGYCPGDGTKSTRPSDIAERPSLRQLAVNRLHVDVTELGKAQIRAEEWWRLNRPKAPNAIREEPMRGVDHLWFTQTLPGR